MTRITRFNPRLIRSCENHALRRAAATFDALAFFGARISWNVANGSLGFIFHLFFTFARTTPMRPDEAPFSVEDFTQLRVILLVIRMFLAKLKRALVKGLLNRVQHLRHSPFKSVLRRRRLLAVIAACEHDLVLVQIFWTNFNT